MKYLLALALFTLSLGSFADTLETESLSLEQPQAELDTYPELEDDLLELKRTLDRRNLNQARKDLKNIITQVRNTRQTQIFSKLGLVYSINRSGYICDQANQARAMATGRNAAMHDCYAAGFTTCREMSNLITTNGYLGTINGTYYGWGCKASVVVRGTN